jgi:hypothetical protein
MALPDTPLELGDAEAERALELLELVLVRVDELGARFDAIELLLDRYRPLLEAAEQRLTKPRFFGGGVRVENQNR